MDFDPDGSVCNTPPLPRHYASSDAHAVVMSDSESSVSIISITNEAQPRRRAAPTATAARVYPSSTRQAVLSATHVVRPPVGENFSTTPPQQYSSAYASAISTASNTSTARHHSSCSGSAVPRRKLREAEVSFAGFPSNARVPHCVIVPTSSTRVDSTSTVHVGGGNTKVIVESSESAEMVDATTTPPLNASAPIDSSVRWQPSASVTMESSGWRSGGYTSMGDSGMSTSFIGTRDEKRMSLELCHVPLNVAVMFNVIITVVLVAVLSIFPLNTVSVRSMEHVTTTLSLSLANTLAQSIEANIIFLPLTVKNFVSAWMLDRDRPASPWTRLDMPNAMRQMCEMISISNSTSNLLYLSLSSPISGYGAYCSPQFSQNYVVGKYTMNNESDYLYLIDPYTYHYTTPKEYYCPVNRMTEWEATVEFGGTNNPWNNVAMHWHEQYLATGNASVNSARGWWVFSQGNASVLTYSFPFVDYEGNLAMISGALQPVSVSTVFPAGLTSSDRLGRAMVVDPMTGLVFINSWREESEVTFANWNESCMEDSGITYDGGLYIDDITDPLMHDAIKHFGGREGLLETPQGVPRWQIKFKRGSSSAIAIANRITAGGKNNGELTVNLLIIYAITRSEYTDNIDTIRTTVIISVVVILIIIALVDLVLIYMFLQPLQDVAAGLRAAAELRDGGDAVEGRISVIKEVADMQYNFKILNTQLMRMKSFLPQGVLGPVAGWSNSEGDGSDFDNSVNGADQLRDYDEAIHQGGGGGGAGRHADAGSLHLNERVLHDEVNKFQRRYCTVLAVCMHIKDSDSTSVEKMERLIECFMESVLPIVLRHGGVIEVQRPDHVVVSFGAHNRIPMHQMRGAKCALEIIQSVSATAIGPRVCCMIDGSEYYVGTCGAAQRNARVAYAHKIPMLTEIIKLSKSLGSAILMTQRLASSLDEAMLTMPIDCIVYTLRTNSNIVYQLRGLVKSLPPYVSEVDERHMMQQTRYAFDRMMQGDYAVALTYMEPFEGRDAQVDRLILTCRTLLSKGIHNPYIRAIGRIKFSESKVHYSDRTASTTGDGYYNLNSSSAENQLVRPALPLELDPCTVLKNTSGATRLIEGADIDASGDEENEDGALFEMFIDADDADDTDSTNSPQPRMGPAVNTVSSGLAGELPMAFVDFEGNAWSRSADQLGVGAFSSVYRGLSDSGNLVALKCFQLRARNIDYNSISEEVRVFASLHHENIVQYISVFVSDTYFIEIMEFVPGGSLDTLLTSFGKLNPPAVRRYLRDILRGLQYLHSKEIVHCDIKPHNVLLAMDGQCKLSDFGSAIAHATTSACNIDDVLEIRGTPAYMAPEVARGEVPSTPSDIFSLGVTVIELLTGALPWDYIDACTNPSLPDPQHRRSSSERSSVTSAAAASGQQESRGSQKPPRAVVPPPAAELGVLVADESLNTSDSQQVGADTPGKGPAISRPSVVSTGTDTDGIENMQGDLGSHSPIRYRRPIGQVLKNPTQLIVNISRGLIVPYVPDSIDADLGDLLLKCVDPDPAKRPSVQELMSHRWLL